MKPNIIKKKGATYMDNDPKMLHPDRGDKDIEIAKLKEELDKKTEPTE